MILNYELFSYIKSIDGRGSYYFAGLLSRENFVLCTCSRNKIVMVAHLMKNNTIFRGKFDYCLDYN